jgi:hypothetical protein
MNSHGYYFIDYLTYLLEICLLRFLLQGEGKREEKSNYEKC